MTDRHEHLDEGTIHAWLDGELPPDESARVEAQSMRCAECASLVAEARGLIAASSRILSSLDAVPAGVVPGSGRDADQLAVLRARKNATSRRWFRDPRVVAAASLIFIAGTFSVVWRASTNESSLTEMQAPVASVSDKAQVADAPSEQMAPPAALPSPGREAKVAAGAPAQDRAPTRIAANRASDSTAVAKVGAATAASETRPVVGAANESVRRESVRQSDLAFSRQGQVQSQAPTQVSADSLARPQAAVSQRADFQRLRTDSIRAAASPPDVRARSMAAAPAAAGASLRLSESVTSVIGCYELRLVVEPGARPAPAADTVRLTDELVPERSDPSWKRARAVGAPSSGAVMTWRQIDSVTVEMRTRTATDSSVVRFQTRMRVLHEGGGQVVATVLPDVQRLRGVQALWATRLECP